MEINRENRWSRASWFAGGAMVSAMAMMMMASGVLQGKNFVPTPAGRTRDVGSQFFVTQSEDGTTAYFWRLDVAIGRTGKTDVVQSDAFFLGAADKASGGGLNQVDIDGVTGQRNIFLEGFAGANLIDNR